MYGFNAFDGVVNIITKSPEEMKGTTLSVAGGSIGTLLTSAVHAGTVGNWGYRISGIHEQTQQWVDRTGSALNSQRMNAVTEYRLSGEGKIRAEAGFGRANPYNGPLNETNTSESHHSLGHALLSYERNGLLVRGWWYGRSSEATPAIFPSLVPLLAQTDRFGRADQQISQNTYDFETRYSFTPLETLKLIMGANFRHIVASSNYFEQRTAENRLGLYAQEDWRVLPSLEVSAGLR